jgi:MFS superfamily sulfate permease-like transporter
VGVAVSLFVVILAQSAATARAYAAKYDEHADVNTDLVGLGLANAAAGFTGTFGVNGSPTKTQMVDSAGGRTQVANLSMAAIVVVVLLFFTEPLQYLPNAVLASVVFLIGLDLIDIAGMRRVYRLNRGEFAVAALTVAMVVLVGVLQGILLAIFLSVVVHLRNSYRPKNTLEVMRSNGTIDTTPLDQRSELLPGLIVYRFAHSMYYANANLFSEEVLELVEHADPPLSWFCLEASAVADVDITAGDTLREIHGQLAERGVRLVLCNINDDVRTELGRYGTLELIGEDAVFDSVDEMRRGFTAAHAPGATSG